MKHQKTKQHMGTSKVVALGLLESVVALAHMCVRYTRRVSEKLAHASFKSPSSKKRFLAIHNKRELGEESFGDGGVWQRAIMMGDKCQPLEFSGVIYYDYDGNRVSELPMKSPRASPLVGYGYSSGSN